MSWFDKLKSIFTKPEPQNKSLNVAVRATLGGAIPGGGWASDHREETRHNTGFNYIAIHALGNQVAAATVSVFDDSINMHGKSKRKSLRAVHGSFSRWKSTYGEGDRETDPIAPDHPLARILMKPNPYETRSDFERRRVTQLRLTGKILIWNVPSVAGPTCERYVLPTAMCTFMPPTASTPWGSWLVSPQASRYAPMVDDGFIEGGPAWTYVLGKNIDARQIQVIWYPHAFWLNDSQSPISAGAHWVDLEEQVDSARNAQLRNGVDPSVVWTIPPEVGITDQDQLDRFQAKINAKYSGNENVGKVIVAQAGTEISPLSTSPKEMCYAEAFQDAKAANLALHQTPPVAVGLQEPGAYAAYNASMKAWRHSAVQPLCDMLAESDTQHLAPQFGEGLIIEIESDVVDDYEQTEKMLANDLAAGIRTRNEWRTLRGLKPLDGPEGDELVGGQQKSDAGGGDKDPIATLEQTRNAVNVPTIEDPDPKMPETPFTRQKTLRAAIQAAEDGDIEWLASRLKSLGMSEGVGADGGFTVRNKSDDESAPACPKCGSTNTTHRRANPPCVCGDCNARFDDHDGSEMKGWITLKPHGADEDGYVHVLVDGDGKIMAGPSHMEGKRVSDLGGSHQQVGSESPTHPAPKRTNDISHKEAPISPKTVDTSPDNDIIMAVAETSHRNQGGSQMELNAELPKLTGSEKQVEWAERIRSKCREQAKWMTEALAGKEHIIENEIEMGTGAASPVSVKEIVDAANEIANERETSAKWWIDYHQMVGDIRENFFRNAVLLAIETKELDADNEPVSSIVGQLVRAVKNEPGFAAEKKPFDKNAWRNRR